MMETEIRERIAGIRQNIADAARSAGRRPEDVRLVAATKTRTPEEIRCAVESGADAVAENRAQELSQKWDLHAYDDMELHFIGHLQTNKVRQVVGRVDLIQSVDSTGLLHAISTRAASLQIVQNILVEVNVAEEAQKSGVTPDNLPLFLELAATFPAIRVCGIMTVAPDCRIFGSNRKIFEKMYRLFVDNSEKNSDNISMNILSMGMSLDYEDAVAEGANMVRIGTALFGPRG